MSTPERDYSETLFLPQTDFPMRAGLPQKEPEILARWEKTGLYKQLRDAAKGREKFILHDGPPYANGNIHIGHALNKILKDVVTRSQQMLGYDSNYVPGWTATACRSNGRSRRRITAPRTSRSRIFPIPWRWSNSARNAAPSRSIGSACRWPNSSGSAS